MIEVEQVAELPRTSADVLHGIVDVGDAQRRRRVGRQLHEPNGSFLRNDMLAEIRLGLDDRMQQRGIEAVAFRIEGNGPPNFLF